MYLQARGFKGSVNIPESCDFQSQFDPLYIFFLPFFGYNFLQTYTFVFKVLNKQIRKFIHCLINGWLVYNINIIN